MTYTGVKKQCFRDMYEARRAITRGKRDWFDPLEDIGVAFDDQGRGRDPYLPDLYYFIESVVYLILSAGKSPEQGVKNSTKEIQTFLAKGPLEDLIAELSEEDQRELRYDLEILEFIPPDLSINKFEF